MVTGCQSKVVQPEVTFFKFSPGDPDKCGEFIFVAKTAPLSFVIPKNFGGLFYTRKFDVFSPSDPLEF